MADRLVSASNKISLGVSGSSAEASILSNPVTGTITSDTRGSLVQSGAAADVTIPFPAGITNAQAVYIKTTDNTTGEDKEAEIRFNGVATGAAGSYKANEVNVFCKTNPNITAVVVRHLGGNPTKIEWLLAG